MTRSAHAACLGTPRATGNGERDRTGRVADPATRRLGPKTVSQMQRTVVIRIVQRDLAAKLRMERNVSAHDAFSGERAGRNSVSFVTISRHRREV